MAVFIKGIPQLDRGLALDTVLRRYLDAAKFFDLVHTSRLFFCRGDSFQDKYEGAFTQSIKHAIEKSYADNDIEFTFEEFKKRLRERVFLNCWHASADDSMAMWQMYGGSSTSVAITTTVRQLRDALQHANLPYKTSIRKVRYVKHWRDPDLKVNPYSNVFAYKVKAYEFEKEVRVMLDRFQETFDCDPPEGGIAVDVPLRKLLRSIVVCPESPQWFFNLVNGVVQKYALDTPVRRSKLAFDPI